MYLWIQKLTRIFVIITIETNKQPTRLQNKRKQMLRENKIQGAMRAMILSTIFQQYFNIRMKQAWEKNDKTNHKNK